jgi:hypothetical protein
MTGFIISRLLDFQSLILTDLERKYIETKHSKTLVGGLEVQWLCKFKTSGQKVNIDIMQGKEKTCSLLDDITILVRI